MKVLVIDGQGGRLGKQIIETVKTRYPEIEITSVGTNSIATNCMQKGGAELLATGENACVVCAQKTDVIIGPVGIVIADSMLGEITPKMACAVGASAAVKILIPINKCNNIVAGAHGTITEFVNDAVNLLGTLKK